MYTNSHVSFLIFISALAHVLFLLEIPTYNIKYICILKLAHQVKTWLYIESGFLSN